jgi:hypothetical protein
MTDGPYLHFLVNLKPGLSTLQGTLTAYLVVTSAIGITSMALVQTLKDQLPLRKWFQRWRVRNWIKEGLNSPTATAVGVSASSDRAVEQDLLRLAVDGDEKAFYSLAIEKLCGQLNAAAQSALQTPSAHAGLLTVLASEADPTALRLVLAGLPGSPDGTPLSPSDPASLAYTAARPQVTQQIQRAIDALQLAVSADWQVHLQQAALALSIVIAGLGAASSPGLRALVGIAPVQDFLFIALTGVLAGFLAPVARDLIAALQNLRS